MKANNRLAVKILVWPIFLYWISALTLLAEEKTDERLKVEFLAVEFVFPDKDTNIPWDKRVDYRAVLLENEDFKHRSSLGAGRCKSKNADKKNAASVGAYEGGWAAHLTKKDRELVLKVGRSADFPYEGEISLKINIDSVKTVEQPIRLPLQKKTLKHMSCRLLRDDSGRPLVAQSVSLRSENQPVFAYPLDDSAFTDKDGVVSFSFWADFTYELWLGLEGPIHHADVFQRFAIKPEMVGDKPLEWRVKITQAVSTTPRVETVGFVASVSDKKTSKPLLGCLVSLRNVKTDAVRRLKTDASGVAVFDDLPEGDYLAWLQMDGYAEMKSDLQFVAKEKKQWARSWPLESLHEISVRVRDADGAPLRDALVVLIPKGVGSKDRKKEFAERTNAEGLIHLGGLREGEYFSVVTVQRPTFRKQVNFVQVVAGKELALQMLPTVQVRGQVKGYRDDSSSEHLEGGEAAAQRPGLFLVPAGVPPILGVQCAMDGEGAFSAVAHPGRHTVRLFDRKRNEWLELGSVNVKENEEITVEYETTKKIKFDQFEGF